MEGGEKRKGGVFGPEGDAGECAAEGCGEESVGSGAAGGGFGFEDGGGRGAGEKAGEGGVDPAGKDGSEVGAGGVEEERGSIGGAEEVHGGAWNGEAGIGLGADGDDQGSDAGEFGGEGREELVSAVITGTPAEKAGADDEHRGMGGRHQSTRSTTMAGSTCSRSWASM